MNKPSKTPDNKDSAKGNSDLPSVLPNLQERYDSNENKSFELGKHAKESIRFDAISIDTIGFKFDRDEANQR